MDFQQLSDALRNARGFDVGSDVYYIDSDGDAVPVSGVEVQNFKGRNIIVLNGDLANYIDGHGDDDETDDDPETDPPGILVNETNQNIGGSDARASEATPQGVPAFNPDLVGGAADIPAPPPQP